MVQVINRLTATGLDQVVQGNDGVYLFTVYPQVQTGMTVVTDQHIGYLSFQGIQLCGVSSPCHGVVQDLHPGAARNGSVVVSYSSSPAAPVATVTSGGQQSNQG